MPIGRPDDTAWRVERLIPSVVVDAGPFNSDLHRSAAQAGANLVRIEIPGSNANFICNSIWRTDLAATTLEHVIGVHYGVLAVNRGLGRVAYQQHAPLAPGQALNIPGGGKRDILAKRAG